MAVRCSKCTGFKKYYKSYCKKCARRRGQRGRFIGSLFKKAKKLAKKAVKSDIAKMAISQGLAYAPKLYDLDTSRIENKKVKQLLQSEMVKGLLNKGINKAYSNL